MKKLLSYGMIFLCSVAALAAETTFDVKMSAEAIARFGIDLDALGAAEGTEDSPSTSFGTGASVEIFMLLREQANEELGEGKLYGWVKIHDLEVFLSNDTTEAGSDGISVSVEEIEAEIRFGPYVYVNLLASTANPDFASDLSLITESILESPYALSLSDINTYDTGLSIGTRLLNNRFNFELGLFSEEFWGEPEVAKHTWQGLLSYQPIDIFSFSLLGIVHYSWVANINDFTLIHYGAEASLSFHIPFLQDFYFQSSTRLSLVGNPDDLSIPDMQLTQFFAIDWSAQGLKEEDISLPYFQDDVEVSSGFSLSLDYFFSDRPYALSIAMNLYEDIGDEGLMPIIGTSLIFNAHMDFLEETFDIALAFYLECDLGIPQPYIGLIYTKEAIPFENLLRYDPVQNQILQVKLGIELHNLIRKASIILDWSSSNLLKPSGEAIGISDAVFSVNGNINGYLGQISITAKIFYENF